MGKRRKRKRKESGIMPGTDDLFLSLAPKEKFLILQIIDESEQGTEINEMIIVKNMIKRYLKKERKKRKRERILEIL